MMRYKKRSQFFPKTEIVFYDLLPVSDLIYNVQPVKETVYKPKYR